MGRLGTELRGSAVGVTVAATFGTEWRGPGLTAGLFKEVVVVVVETVVKVAVNDLRGCSGAGRDGMLIVDCVFVVDVGDLITDGVIGS